MVRNFVKYFKILWKYIIKCYKSPSIFGWAFLSLLGLIQLWSSRWLQLQLNCSFWHFVWQGKWTFQTRRGNNIKACITICVFHQVSEISNYLSSILWLNVVSHFFSFRKEVRVHKAKYQVTQPRVESVTAGNRKCWVSGSCYLCVFVCTCV